MKKLVTDQASFVLYLPEGWKARESVQGNLKSVVIVDPQALHQVARSHGVSPGNRGTLALVSLFAHQLKSRYPELTISRVMISRDEQRATFEGVFNVAPSQGRQFRAWIGTSGHFFTYSRIEAPEGRLAEATPLLLTILANIHLMKEPGGRASGPGQVALR